MRCEIFAKYEFYLLVEQKDFSLCITCSFSPHIYIPTLICVRIRKNIYNSTVIYAWKYKVCGFARYELRHVLNKYSTFLICAWSVWSCRLRTFLVSLINTYTNRKQRGKKTNFIYIFIILPNIAFLCIFSRKIKLSIVLFLSITLSRI